MVTEDLKSKMATCIGYQSNLPKSTVIDWPEDRSKPPKGSLCQLTAKERNACITTARQVYIDNRDSYLGSAHTVQEVAKMMCHCISTVSPSKYEFCFFS